MGIIAISGLSGCGNSTSSKKVASALKIPCQNYTLRNLAQDLKLPFAQVQEGAKKNPQYDFAVDRKQALLAASKKSLVIASRLAIWLDDKRVLKKIGLDASKPRIALKIWLEAPLSIRAKRIAKRENISYASALAQTRKRDLQNKARYKKLYGLEVPKQLPKGVVVVDTDKNNADEVAKIILLEYRKISKKGV